MIPLTVKQVAHILSHDGQALSDTPVTGFCTDTRTLSPGQCFVALAGQTFDGHDYIERALEAGASCVLSARRGDRGNVICVPDTIEALGRMARWYRGRLKARVVCITGSAGKTTTRELIYAALSGRFRCHQSPKSFNNNIGLPMTLLTAPEDTEVIIAEIGANHPGEIAALTEIAAPDIALITNVHPAHLEGFGSIDTIIEEKASIARGLAPGGKLIINGHFQDLVEHCRGHYPGFLTFGQAPYYDIHAENMTSNGLSGQVRIDSRNIEVPLPGRASLENVIAAWAVCSRLGLSLEAFADRIAQAQPANMRLQVEKIGANMVLNDCYNANLASMDNALDCLRQVAAAHPGKRSVFICGEMAELGDQSRFLHAQLGSLIADRRVELLLLVGPHAQTVLQNALKNTKVRLDYHIFSDTGELCDKLHHFLRPDDIILIKGSRCMRLERAVDAIKSIIGPKKGNTHHT